MARTEEEQKNANTMFDKRRDDLDKRDLSNTEHYDKAILTLSSSCLALSLTAIKFIIPIATASYIVMLISAWILLTLSIICSLIAYQVSNKAIAIEMNNAIDYYIEGIEDARSRKNRFRSFNSFLNLVTGITFGIALCLIVTFMAINIKIGETTMSDKKGTGTHIEKSANTQQKSFNVDSANVRAMERVPSANVPTTENPSSTTTTSKSSSSSGNK